MLRISRNSLPALAIMLLGTTANAQTRPFYATDGSGPAYLYSIQGSAVTNQIATGDGAYALAVGSTIRTFGSSSGYAGTEYSLSLSPMGGSYPNTNPGCCILDGTTDGTYNYATNFFNEVWRAGTDWSGMTRLFGVGYTPIGIAYDSGTNTLWVGQYGNGTSSSLFQYALDGTLLFSFTPSFAGGSGPVNGITALAYDAADQTLWFSDYNQYANLYHYTTSGAQLGVVSVSGTYGYLVGAEFQVEAAAVPEPGSLVLVGTGLIAVVGVAARRRRI